MIRRVVTLRQECRPPRLVDLIERRQLNAAQMRRWELRAQGFVAAILMLGVGWYLAFGTVVPR